MKKINFTKLCATGNDFILIDNRENILTGDEVELFRRICQRRLSVGADGVLLLEKSINHHFSLRYFNSDGSLGEMCGNGARASAFYASAHKIAPAEQNIDVLGVTYHALIRDNSVQLIMPPPLEIREYPGVLQDKEFEEGGYLNVGVPHYVIFVPAVKSVDINYLGKKYRYHNAFQPRGANVNFVQIAEKDKIFVRTYERGVEEETLTCGTGTISSAILAVRQKQCSLPLKAMSSAGILLVNFDNPISKIILEGEVKEVYSGKLING
jgi:diaminopimelate epimerase